MLPLDNAVALSYPDNHIREMVMRSGDELHRYLRQDIEQAACKRDAAVMRPEFVVLHIHELGKTMTGKILPVASMLAVL
ncbi:MAG: hypothetical protein WCA64_07675 [Gallionella sp.]